MKETKGSGLGPEEVVERLRALRESDVPLLHQLAQSLWVSGFASPGRCYGSALDFVEYSGMVQRLWTQRDA